MRQNMSSSPWKWFCSGVLVLALLSLRPPVSRAQMVASAQTVAGTNLEQSVAASVRNLQASVQSLTPEQWKTSGNEKQEMTAAQQSLQRNLSEAVPGLLQAWNRAPQNLSEAFRLYRDLDAVYQVTSRLEASAGEHAPSDQARTLTASTGQLKRSLQQLGDYIQATATLQYTQMQQARAAAAHPAPAPAPKSIVINDANAAPAHTAHRKRAHKKAAPKKAAPKPTPPQGGMD